MSAPQQPELPPTVKLLPRLIDALSYKPADIDGLAEELYKSAVTAWRGAMAEMSIRYGCGRRAAGPSGGDENYLRSVARSDAESIAQTFNNDIARELTKQFNENPRSNRYAYLERIEGWSTRRYEWKQKQIAVQMAQKARRYAQQRFRDENKVGDSAKYRYNGPAPVSDICKARTAAGFVPKTYVDSNPTPGHPGPCVHEWTEVSAKYANCSKLWVG